MFRPFLLDFVKQRDDAKSRSTNQSSTTFKLTRLPLAALLDSLLCPGAPLPWRSLTRAPLSLASSCNSCIGSLPLLLLLRRLPSPFTCISLSALGLHSSFHHPWSHATTFRWSSLIRCMTWSNLATGLTYPDPGHLLHCLSSDIPWELMRGDVIICSKSSFEWRMQFRETKGRTRCRDCHRLLF